MQLHTEAETPTEHVRTYLWIPAFVNALSSFMRCNCIILLYYCDTYRLKCTSGPCFSLLSAYYLLITIGLMLHTGLSSFVTVEHTLHTCLVGISFIFNFKIKFCAACHIFAHNKISLSMSNLSSGCFLKYVPAASRVITDRVPRISHYIVSMKNCNKLK